MKRIQNMVNGFRREMNNNLSNEIAKTEYMAADPLMFENIAEYLCVMGGVF